MWKKFVSEYLTFSKKDRIGMSVLAALMAITLLAPLLFPYLRKEKPGDDNQTKETIRKINALFSDSAIQQHADESEMPDAETHQLFFFDPNTATMEEWQQLGVRKNIAATIHKYLSKGGKFSTPQDLKKIYNLSAKDVERLTPYVRIRTTTEHFTRNTQIKYPEPVPVKNSFPAKKRYEIIDINLADTSAFISLPGIGSKLASRIVNFREKLGGFITVEQVGETRFLPDSTFQMIRAFLKSDNQTVRKININHAPFDALNAHPYISYQVANAIVQYRKQNGDFKLLEDLKKIHIIDDQLFSKIAPYLTVD